ncbi:hypothetical protein LGH70_12610 [Hymenobacter sp. BT635]|uniref:Lipocalin-like domain-containing protein n=1 Tax=Hymenobacter nitidus TaxID=2880929 RepID=A0ABS8ADD7_9BACT|nr:lipocalin family protein [Hymenobacter nitidus]MCB2378433.1 hypothetical protein [Hymenobacter nitidus]
MKRLYFLLLLGVVGLLAAWTWTKTTPSTAEQRILLLVNHDWVWTSWTENTGPKASRQRIEPCLRDDVIRFERAGGKQVYIERAGRLRCSAQAKERAQGEWSVSADGRLLTITGGNGAFDDTWQIAELTASHLQLAYRTTTTDGPFSMLITFTKRPLGH